jgi:hypothetical protein
MARQPAMQVENNFSKGLITEATGLNFPENACTETYNCIFNIDGSVKRRKGFDFEIDYSTKNINRANAVINTYLWKNVAGNGDVTLLVVQVGNTLYFYETSENSLSSGAISDTVTLTPVSGAPGTEAIEAQFSDGNGYLFVTHPYCEPMRISYDVTTDNATATNITIQIRDFEGDTADLLAVDTRPTSSLAGLSAAHHYNLLNQGWIETNLTSWDGSRTDMPSNVDIMWSFTDSGGSFTVADAGTVAKVWAGNSPAPKGHFILPLHDQNRVTASGVTGATSTTTSYQRPSTSAWFAGRVFYSGINYVGYNSKIYFTQIIERPEQYGLAHQVNDPASQDLFDLLPSDGGVINIPEAGTIFKLVAVPGGLCVFAGNGIWFITGSTGIGFTANDYTVQKIANISTLSATSFINVAGYPMWWNTEGIYTISVEGNSTMPSIKPLTYTTIRRFYEEIPESSKRIARGFYNHITGTVQWLYRSEGTDQISEQYEFDSILNFSTRTGAFYPWTISDSDVKINGMVMLDSVAGQTSVDTVMAGADNVIDASGNQVISFTTSGVAEILLSAKFLVSYPSGSTYAFTFAEETSETYRDWFQHDVLGVDYESYFVSGFRIKGGGLQKFQSGWVSFFSRVEEEVSYYAQGMWNFANTGSGTGRWTSRQLVTHSDPSYSFVARRLKIRGNGITLQLKIESRSGYPFEIIGWSNLSLVNQTP